MRVRRLAAQSILFSATIAACSSPASPSPTGSATGTVAGHSLSVSDGVAEDGASAAIPYVFVDLGSRSPLCSLEQSATGGSAPSNQIASLTDVEFQLYDQRSKTLSVGTFPVVAGGVTTQDPLGADVLFSVSGPNCEMVTHQWATASTVTLTALQPSVKATFDLMFGADHVTGSFDAQYCGGVHLQGSGGSAPDVCEK